MLVHEGFQLMGSQGVQTHKGFIQQNKPGLMDEGRHQGNFLLHAVGTVGNGQGQIVGHAQLFPEFLNAGGPVGLADPVNICCKIQILEACEKFVQVRVVRHIGKGLLAGNGVLSDGVAADGDLPLVKGQNTAAGFQCGGLSGTVVADEAANFAGSDVQGQVADGLFVAVGFREMFNGQHRLYLRFFRSLFQRTLDSL